MQLTKEALRRPGLLRDDNRKSRALKQSNAIVTGFDLYSEEEVAKQSQRSARFGTAPAEKAAIVVAAPSAVEQARKARAEKSGIPYEEPDPTGTPRQTVDKCQQYTKALLLSASVAGILLNTSRWLSGRFPQTGMFLNNSRWLSGLFPQKGIFLNNS